MQLKQKDNYSKNMTHGEAVLSGIILATRLSVIKKICNIKTLQKIERIYISNKLTYTYKKFNSENSLLRIIPYLKNDKKNDDDKINFILLKEIGSTTLPNKNKISLKDIVNLN